MTDNAADSLARADHAWRTAFTALIAGAVAIAFAPIFVRLSDLGPTATAFWRVALAAPVLLVWMSAVGTAGPRRNRRPSSLRDYARLSLVGLFFAGDLLFWHWSIRFTTVANSTLLANFAPIFVTLLCWVLFGERFSRTFLAALALAITGAVVLMGNSLSISPEHLFGDFLGIVTAMFYGAYIVAVGRLRNDFSTATIMAWSSVVTAIALLPAALIGGESLFDATLAGWAVLLALAWISHAGGQSLIAYALAHLPAAFSSLSLLVQPVAAAVLAWLILAEPIGPWQAAGGAIVLVGIAIARRGSMDRPAPSRR